MLYKTITSPISDLTAEIDGGRLLSLSRAKSVFGISSPLPEDEAMFRVLERELGEYFRGECVSFSVDIAPHGTEFQLAVWREMQKIPYGEVRTYGEIAKAVGRSGAARAVGQACHVNPILILIPCHRVVSSSGIGGFAIGLDRKKILLKIEEQRQN